MVRKHLKVWRPHLFKLIRMEMSLNKYLAMPTFNANTKQYNSSVVFIIKRKNKTIAAINFQ